LKSPSLVILPVLFVVILYFAYPYLSFTFEDRDRDYRFPASIIFVNSFLVQFWILALVSGQPAYKPWKAVLVYNVGIILPGWLGFLYSYIFIANLIGKQSNYPVIFIAWAIILFILFWGCYRLLKSGLFTPYIGECFDYGHIWFLIITAVTIFAHNYLIYLSIIYSL